MDQNDPVKFDPATVASDAYKRGAEAARPPVRLDALNEQEGTAVTVISPNGQLAIPRTWTLPLLVLGGITQVVGEELANPAPWTAPRVTGLVLKLVTFFTAGIVGGLPKPGTQAIGITARVVSTKDGAQ